MSSPNKESRLCWAYESVPGTAAITAVNSTSYFFGEYDERQPKFTAPTIQKPVEAFWSYAHRYPELSKKNTEFEVLKVPFIPTTAQWAAWILKAVTDDPSDKASILDTGKNYPLTIRLEEKGGTNPMLAQAVGAYCIEGNLIAEFGLPFMAELTFAFQTLEDQGDRPILTTAPLEAGGVSGGYVSDPEIKWDVDGTPETIDAATSIMASVKQDYKYIDYDEGNERIVNLGKYQPFDVKLLGLLKTTTLWDAFIDETVKNMTIKVYKADPTYYQTINLENVNITSIVKSGEKWKGLYPAVLLAQAEQISVDFNFSSEGSNFSTHFKGAVP